MFLKNIFGGNGCWRMCGQARIWMAGPAGKCMGWKGGWVDGGPRLCKLVWTGEHSDVSAARCMDGCGG